MVEGTDLLSAKVSFKSKTDSGKEIYHDSFPSLGLLGYGLIKSNQHPTDNKRRAYIKKRVAAFFKARAFSQPAIPETEIYDAEIYHKSAWDELYNTPQSRGFHYLTYEENGKSIAFSHIQNKVIVYQTCC